MKKYVVYDDTGKILRFGVCGNGDINLQPLNDEQVVEVKELRDKLDMNFTVIGKNGRLHLESETKIIEIVEDERK